MTAGYWSSTSKDNKDVCQIMVASTATFYRQQLLKVVVGAIYVIGFNCGTNVKEYTPWYTKIDFLKLLCELIW